MRNNLLWIIGLIAAFSLNSCSNDDGFNMGNYWLDVATVNQIEGNTESFYLTLDNGKRLLPISFDSYSNPQFGKRVIVKYTLLSDKMDTYDNTIKINSIQNILTKEVIDMTSENEKEIGDDPIKILSIWTGDNFLNIRFGYNAGGEEVHAINLVRNKLNQATTTEDGTVVLEFRHNANGDPQKYGVNNYAAFYLKPFQVQNKDSVNFMIRVIEFNDQIKEYPVTYKYK